MSVWFCFECPISWFLHVFLIKVPSFFSFPSLRMPRFRNPKCVTIATPSSTEWRTACGRRCCCYCINSDRSDLYPNTCMHINPLCTRDALISRFLVSSDSNRWLWWFWMMLLNKHCDCIPTKWQLYVSAEYYWFESVGCVTGLHCKKCNERHIIVIINK